MGFYSKTRPKLTDEQMELQRILARVHEQNNPDLMLLPDGRRIRWREAGMVDKQLAKLKEKKNE